MTENQAREAIYAALTAAWAPSPPVSMAFDNEVFDANGKTEWARAILHHVGGGQHTLGGTSRIFRRQALLVVQIHVALDKGMQRMDALARLVIDGLEQKVIGDVWYQDSEYREGGGGDGYRTGTVSIPVTYDEVK